MLGILRLMGMLASTLGGFNDLSYKVELLR